MVFLKKDLLSKAHCAEILQNVVLPGIAHWILFCENCVCKIKRKAEWGLKYSSAYEYVKIELYMLTHL